MVRQSLSSLKIVLIRISRTTTSKPVENLNIPQEQVESFSTSHEWADSRNEPGNLVKLCMGSQDHFLISTRDTCYMNPQEIKKKKKSSFTLTNLWWKEPALFEES